jgi:hypothetical protein
VSTSNKSLSDESVLTQSTASNRQQMTNDDASQTKTNKKTDKGCESDEVLAVLCHEFGHWSLSHNLINLCISFVRKHQRTNNDIHNPNCI